MTRSFPNATSRILAALTLGAVVAASGSSRASAQSAAAAAPSATVTLTRLQCGTNAPPTDVGLRFSDTFAFSGVMVQLTYSCYLIRHNDDYLIWDTGFAKGPAATAPKQSLLELLTLLGLAPASVKFVGISHYHGDHVGQTSSFPQATLLIGKGDWDVVNDSVIVLNMPGHTPGHHSLLVKLKETGNVLITGDLSHFRENYDSNGIPTFNTDRAASLASIDRFKQIARNLKATVIIQHDQRDVAKLPVFPAAAK